MSKYIIYERIYDTEKSEAVLEVKYNKLVDSMFARRSPGTLWHTKKGNWFVVMRNGHALPVSGIEVRNFLLKGSLELYEKYFGVLEEA